MSENAKIKVGDFVRCGSLIFQVSNLYINHTGLKVCYFEGENPNECFVPHHMCEPVRLAWNTRPTDDRVSKLVEAAQAALDGGMFKHPSIREKLQQALEAL